MKPFIQNSRHFRSISSKVLIAQILAPVTCVLSLESAPPNMTTAMGEATEAMITAIRNGMANSITMEKGTGAT
jgi:hypothetical protein